MPKYGAHTFLWVDEWTTEKGNQAIAATGEAGFDFIEISLMRPDDFDAAAHKKALADAGIEATGSLVLPEWAHMPEEPEKAKQFLISALDKLGAVGGTYLGGCTAFALGKFTIEDVDVPQVIGLSGFLTLTFDPMKATIEALEEAGLRDSIKVMIGSGQIDDQIRKHTGADAYGRDAVIAVTFAKQWAREKQSEHQLGRAFIR